MIPTLKSLVRPLIPKALLSLYHRSLVTLAALRFGHPGKHLTVILVTGTKGKSTTCEMLYALLATSGERPALLSTIRFATPERSRPNLFKMSVPGRFFVQRFMREALHDRATHLILEMTSEAIVQHRHLFTYPNAVVFTNLAPEHIESHGSLEQYKQAKLQLRALLEASPKRPRIMVANHSDPVGHEFLKAAVEKRIPYSLADAHPHTTDASGSRFVFRGELISMPLPGEFNLLNALAALTLCEALGLPLPPQKAALEKFSRVPGRTESITRGQDFRVIVDYAHTPDSLRAIYSAFPPRRICVLGNTGGGRDRWKRPEMGRIADEHCDVAILTDEDPYDEDPMAILEEMRPGFVTLTPRIILDRREAIRAALAEARSGDTVLITGKGTDPYIMRAKGMREPWSDKRVVEEELNALLATSPQLSAARKK